LYIYLNVNKVINRAKIKLIINGQEVKEIKTIRFLPEKVYLKKIKSKNKIEKAYLEVLDNKNKKLISYHTAERPLKGKDEKAPNISCCGEKYFKAGLNAEKFNYKDQAIEYYKKALKYDPGFSEANTRLGLVYMKSNNLATAKRYLMSALKGGEKEEAIYYLGQCLKRQDKLKEAKRYFQRLSLSKKYFSLGFYCLGEIEVLKKDWCKAIKYLDKAKGIREALVLSVICFRKLDNIERAGRLCKKIINDYPQELKTYSELVFMGGSIKKFSDYAGENYLAYMEAAYNYGALRLFNEAADILAWAVDFIGGERVPPLVYYSFWYYNKHKKRKLNKYISLAKNLSPEYIFPHRNEEEKILDFYTRVYPKDKKARFYLGNIYYQNGNYKKALKSWRKAIAIDRSFLPAYRNLAFTLWRHSGKKKEAVKYYRQALKLDPKDPWLYYDLDYILAETGNIKERKKLLAQAYEFNKTNDNIIERLVELYIADNRLDLGLKILKKHKFNLNETTTRFTELYKYIKWLKGLKFLEDKNFKKALKEFSEAAEYKPALQEIHSAGDRNAVSFYLIGIIYRCKGEKNKARIFWEKAIKEINDVWNEERYAQALCYIGLGEKEKALKFLKETLRNLDIAVNTKGLCLGWKDYLRGLCYKILGNKKRTESLFKKAILKTPALKARIDFMKRIKELEVNTEARSQESEFRR
jgi:tetratricopeptide (TPR) repeat protein